MPLTQEQINSIRGSAGVTTTASQATEPDRVSELKQAATKYDEEQKMNDGSFHLTDKGKKVADVAGSLISAPATLVARPFQALQSAGQILGSNTDELSKISETNRQSFQALLDLKKSKDAKGEDTSHIDKTLHDIQNSPDFAAQELGNQATYEPSHGGIIAPAPKDFKDVKKDVGRGLQTIALGAGGPITGGALFGAGTSLEHGNDIFSIPTLVDTIVGGVAGKTLDFVGKPILNALGETVAKITPDFIKDVTARGAKAITDFAEKYKILPEDISKAITKTADTTEKIANTPFEFVSNQASKLKSTVQDSAVDKLESDYYDWVGQTKPGVKRINKTDARTEALNKAGTEGNPPQRILAEAKIIPQTEGTEFRTAKQAADFRKSIQPLDDANDKALKEVQMGTEPPKIDDVERTIISNINKQNLPEGDKHSLLAEAQSELNLLRKKYGESIPITELNKQKQLYWKGTKFDSARPFKSDSYYQIGKGMQQSIQDTAEKAGFSDVAQLNREIGDRLEAAKYLESLDGQTIKGGKLGKYVFAGIGASLGSTIPGKIAGALGGEYVAQILMNASVANPVKRLILSSLEEKNPLVYEETLKWLETQGVLRDTRKALPAPSFIPMEAPKPPESTVISVPAKKGEPGRVPKGKEKGGQFFGTFKSGN